MAKKIKEQNPDDMYSKYDQTEILRLYKVVVATHEDMESIYRLFKKYLVPNAPRYRTDCQCTTSISKYFQRLLEWYSQNADKF